MSGEAVNDKNLQEFNSVVQQMKTIGISPEHLSDVTSINKYLKDHRINQLFNVSTHCRRRPKPVFETCDLPLG